LKINAFNSSVVHNKGIELEKELIGAHSRTFMRQKEAGFTQYDQTMHHTATNSTPSKRPTVSAKVNLIFPAPY
jgi:hypothetical protein